MRINRAKVVNYKSFYETDWIEFAPGLNVIIGQNNVGKTAFVEALSLNFGPKPHRSLRTVPKPTNPNLPPSLVEVEFELDRAELLEILAAIGEFLVPKYADPRNGTFPNFVECIEDRNTVYAKFLNGGVTKAFLKSYGDVENQTSEGLRLENGKVIRRDVGGVDVRTQYGNPLSHHLRDRIYSFKAERMAIGQGAVGTHQVLASNANNLPEVLLLMSQNPKLMEEFNYYVRTIFPSVRTISLRPIAENRAEILVWTVDPGTKRQDLTVQLLESGTGIGQVLSMLYVIMTSLTPRTIIIDEPQSFLHPGAVRKLIEIFREYSQHQYIITTHSPTALTTGNPDVLLLVTMENAEAKIEVVDPNKTEQLRLVLAEVGARISDVFGADNVLWVEGRTEELCFPIILEKLHKPLRGTAIVGILQVGDLEGRQSKTAFEIYEKLSHAGGVIPPSIGFIFDREGRTNLQQEDLVRQSRGKVVFTPRRMFENYLLRSEAIADVLSQLMGETIPPGRIEEWFEANRWNGRYFATLPQDRTLTTWRTEVHAPKIMNDLFLDISATRFEYSKTEHGLALTRWIAEHAPGDLQELSDLIVRRLDAGTTPQP